MTRTGGALRMLAIGRQSILLPSQWSATLRAKPRLREQLRRARAKGVRVRRVDAGELAEGAPLRARVEALREEWLDSRRMEPMAFLVSVEPFHHPSAHIYLVAERDGVAVQFLSAVPIYARAGWLVEDVLRARRVPNGTTELLLDLLMRESVQAADGAATAAADTVPVDTVAVDTAAVDTAAEGTSAAGTSAATGGRARETTAPSVSTARSVSSAPSASTASSAAPAATFITPGLTPLAGAMPWWLRLARSATRPLYDFAGLERFRARLAPARWDPVWLVWDRGPAPLVLLHVLDAFAGSALPRFAWRSIVRHPSGPPWALALPLVPWTLLLAALTLAGRADLLGFSRAALAAWTLFDAGLAWLLFRAAQQPGRRRIGLAAAAALFDAVLSIAHLTRAGLGMAIGPEAGMAAVTLRLVATLAPSAGSAALLWALWRARRPIEH